MIKYIIRPHYVNKVELEFVDICTETTKYSVFFFFERIKMKIKVRRENILIFILINYIIKRTNERIKKRIIFSSLVFVFFMQKVDIYNSYSI
jgi:hypothetical protein